MYPSTAFHVKSTTSSARRARQVGELKAELPGVVALNCDESLFELPLPLRDGHGTKLRISLPPLFPEARPGLSVTRPLQHPAVDQSGRITVPSLQQWGLHSSLVSIVAEAYSALTGTSAPSLGAARPAAAFESQQQQQRAPRSSTSQVVVPHHFPVLQAASAEALHLALLDDDAFRVLVLQETAKLDTLDMLQQLQEGNRDLAAANLSREAELGELRNQIAIVRCSEYAVAKEAFDERAARQEAVLEKLKPSILIASLAAAAEAVDVESNMLFDKFSDSEIPLDAFVQQHLKLRTLYHTRELKRHAAQQMQL